MSTLAVVEEVLRETAVPMSVREIVIRAGARLPSRSKTPDTVVARDLAMDLKRKGLDSLFARTSPGRYTLRALVVTSPIETAPVTIGAPIATPTSATAGALKHDRAPALAAKRDRATTASDAATQAG